MSFADDLRRFADKTAQKQATVYRKTAMEIFGRVIMRTPVDTGRLRGNWQASVNAMASGEVDRLDDASPANQNGLGESTAKADMEAVVLGADVTQPVYLTNHLPYAQRIEYEGWSGQAPAGMVRVSVAEFQGVVEDLARKE